MGEVIRPERIEVISPSEWEARGSGGGMSGLSPDMIKGISLALQNPTAVKDMFHMDDSQAQNAKGVSAGLATFLAVKYGGKYLGDEMAGAIGGLLGAYLGKKMFGSSR